MPSDQSLLVLVRSVCDHTVIFGVMCHVRNYGFIYKRYPGLLYGTMDTARTLTADLGL